MCADDIYDRIYRIWRQRRRESRTVCCADIYSKQRAFRDFWMGGSPLIGDEGAAGWSASVLQAAATSPAHVPAEGRDTCMVQ